MRPFRVITPVAAFPDPAVKALMFALHFVATTDTVGSTDHIQEWGFASPDGATSVRYLFEPELEIPCILVSGAAEVETADAIRATHPNFDPLGVALSYTTDASDTVKNTILATMAAQSLEQVIPPMLRAVGLAARDLSPYVRLAAVRVAQYAHNSEIAALIRPLAAFDPDPDVRGFAQSVLEVFDAAPSRDTP